MAEPLPPRRIIRASSGWTIAEFKELLEFRDVLVMFALRDLKLRYRQTALGAIWVVVQPLIAGAILAFVFGRVARLSSGGVPYFALAYVGFVGWSFFSSTLTRASGSLVQHAALISKVFFPRVLLPVSAVLSSLVDVAVALLVLLPAAPFFGVRLGYALAALPIWLASLGLLGLGLGLVAGGLMVRYRDVQHVLPVLVQLLMYGSPVAYAALAVPERLRGYFLLNPLAPTLEGLRWSLLGTARPDGADVAYAVTISVLVFVAGAVAFRRLERGLADVI